MPYMRRRLVVEDACSPSFCAAERAMRLTPAPVSSSTPILCPLMLPSTNGHGWATRTGHSAICMSLHLLSAHAPAATVMAIAAEVHKTAAFMTPPRFLRRFYVGAVRNRPSP